MDLVSIYGSVEVKIIEDVIEEHFKMIEDHVHSHLDAFETLLDERISKYGAFSVVYKEEVKNKLIELTKEYDTYNFSEKTSEEWKLLKERMSKEFTEIFGLPVNVM